ncbi:MAG: DUF6883 domain-containing protein [Candidatus Binatia bacterium]
MSEESLKKLPNIAQALIPRKKIVNYLLSDTHDAGRDKATFFTHFGFTANNWEVLVHALRRHAVQHEITKIETSPFGTRYVIHGALQTPTGRTPQIRAVWFIDTGETIPRFVTAYPLKGE